MARGRILLVEPDAREAETRARALGAAGYDVEAASGGAEVGVCFAREPFDAVLGDAVGGESEALGFVQAIRRLDKEVPVLLLAEDCKSLSRSRFVGGAVEWLEKSIAESELERALERAVRRSRRWRGLAAYRNRRGEETEVASFSATDAKNEFGRVLQKAAHGIVVITRHDEPEAVLISIDEFRELAGARERKLEALTREFDALLAGMQTPEAREGMKAAFDASPARMGEAAVQAARKRG